MTRTSVPATSKEEIIKLPIPEIDARQIKLPEQRDSEETDSNEEEIEQEEVRKANTKLISLLNEPDSTSLNAPPSDPVPSTSGPPKDVVQTPKTQYPLLLQSLNQPRTLGTIVFTPRTGVVVHQPTTQQIYSQPPVPISQPLVATQSITQQLITRASVTSPTESPTESIPPPIPKVVPVWNPIVGRYLTEVQKVDLWRQVLNSSHNKLVNWEPDREAIVERALKLGTINPRDGENLLKNLLPDTNSHTYQIVKQLHKRRLPRDVILREILEYHLLAVVPPENLEGTKEYVALPRQIQLSLGRRSAEVFVGHSEVERALAERQYKYLQLLAEDYAKAVLPNGSYPVFRKHLIDRITHSEKLATSAYYAPKANLPVVKRTAYSAAKALEVIDKSFIKTLTEPRLYQLNAFGWVQTTLVNYPSTVRDSTVLTRVFSLTKYLQRRVVRSRKWIGAIRLLHHYHCITVEKIKVPSPQDFVTRYVRIADEIEYTVELLGLVSRVYQKHLTAEGSKRIPTLEYKAILEFHQEKLTVLRNKLFSITGVSSKLSGTYINAIKDISRAKKIEERLFVNEQAEPVYHIPLEEAITADEDVDEVLSLYLQVAAPGEEWDLDEKDIFHLRAKSKSAVPTRNLGLVLTPSGQATSKGRIPAALGKPPEPESSSYQEAYLTSLDQ